MVKHILESLARTAFLTPHYISHDRELSLVSPRNILNKYLNQNIATLNFANSLDKKAMKIQETGVAIICGDVPEIPIRLDYKMENLIHQSN